MGKNIIVKGADFSANALDIREIVIDFSNATVKPYNIVKSGNNINFVAPTNSSKPCFYEISLVDVTPLYDTLKLLNTEGKTSRLLFTNAALPSESHAFPEDINSYCASTVSESFFDLSDSTEVSVSIPNNAQYLYIRKLTSSGDNTTPDSAKFV